MVQVSNRPGLTPNTLFPSWPNSHHAQLVEIVFPSGFVTTVPQAYLHKSLRLFFLQSKQPDQQEYKCPARPDPAGYHSVSPTLSDFFGTWYTYPTNSTIANVHIHRHDANQQWRQTNDE
jgi:hypothetical protein